MQGSVTQSVASLKPIFEIATLFGLKDGGNYPMTLQVNRDGALVSSYSMADAGQAANQAVAKAGFAQYQERKSSNSQRSHLSDLKTFHAYLCSVGVDCPTAEELQEQPSAWRDVTHGLISGFVQWLRLNGYALTSLNRKLSTVKVYAGLASAAGVIGGNELALIKTVKGYAAKEFKRVDDKRQREGLATRSGAKKVKGAVLTPEQARMLKSQPDTPQGRRDAVILCLLIDHGLRVGELAALQVGDVDLGNGYLHFYRPKVSKVQTHKLSKDSLAALKAYIEQDATALGPLLRGSRKSGELDGSGMGERSISVRVGMLGESIGVDNLSSHDLRHYWATWAIRKGKDPFQVLQAGGWTSMQTVKKYVEETVVANEGLNDD